MVDKSQKLDFQNHEKAPRSWPVPVAIVCLALAIPIASVVLEFETLGSGRLGSGALGGLSVVAWWLTLAPTVAAAFWVIRHERRPSVPTKVKRIGLVLAGLIGAFLWVGGAALGIWTTRNVAQGWNQPYMTNAEVVANVGTFSVPVIMSVALLAFSVWKIIRKFETGWTRSMQIVFLVLVSGICLFSFELIPHLFSVP